MYTENITVNGITYKMIDEAEIRQELLPSHREATAYGSWLCVRADEQPDDIGTVALYEFKYVLIDPEDYRYPDGEWYDNVDWEAPDDIAESQYRWLVEDQRIV